MRLVWYQRADGLWNATCACNTTISGIAFERRAYAADAHHVLTILERKFRETHPDRFAGPQIPDCGPKLPEPNPNIPGPLVLP